MLKSDAKGLLTLHCLLYVKMKSYNMHYKDILYASELKLFIFTAEVDQFSDGWRPEQNNMNQAAFNSKSFKALLFI